MSGNCVTDEELLLLDGKCGKETQGLIDSLKLRNRIAESRALTDSEATFVRDVLNEASTNKTLIFRSLRIRRCPVCNTAAGYAKRTRSSRSGRRGEPNYDRPLTMYGYELARRFFVIKDTPTIGCCTSCWKKIQPILAEELSGVPAEIPQDITGIPPRFKAYDVMKCTKCGWVGSEHLMGKLPAVMGGFYPGKCPECGAEHLPFGPIIFNRTDERVLVLLEVQS